MNKVLLFDIESSPNLAYVWGKYQQDVIEFQSEWEMLSFSAKWLNGKSITLGRDTHSEKQLVTELHKLFNEADIIIGHNGDKFDIKKTNAKFLEFGLTPPSPYKTIDTLKIARRYFAFNSNRLGDLGQKLGLGKKVHTGGFQLWQGCMKNDPKSWYLMKKYNKQDVVLLEKIYLKFLPWIQNHPALEQGSGCPNCTSTNLQKRGYAVTRKHKYQRYQCQDCSAWSQVRL